MTLVPIPWQPHLFLTPRTLGYLQRAGDRLGRNLYLADSDYQRISPAWRPYAQQKTAWDLFIVKKGPVASNPDSGQRGHMRGAAFDLRETSKTVRAACAAVGLIPDGTELWHWNDPAWASMPIIATMPAGGGGSGATPQEAQMQLMIVSGETYYTGIVDDGRWMDITPSPADFQNALLAAHGNPADSSRGVRLWTAAQRTAYKVVFSKYTVASAGVVDVEPVVAAAKAGAEAGVATLKIPTAAENGKAARDAIVKPA